MGAMVADMNSFCEGGVSLVVVFFFVWGREMDVEMDVLGYRGGGEYKGIRRGSDGWLG